MEKRKHVGRGGSHCGSQENTQTVAAIATIRVQLTQPHAALPTLKKHQHEHKNTNKCARRPMLLHFRHSINSAQTPMMSKLAQLGRPPLRHRALRPPLRKAQLLWHNDAPSEPDRSGMNPLPARPLGGPSDTMSSPAAGAICSPLRLPSGSASPPVSSSARPWPAAPAPRRPPRPGR